MKNILKLNFIQWCDTVCLCILTAGMVYSPFLFTVALYMMMLRVLFVGPLKEKIKNIQSNKIILPLLQSLFWLSVAGLLWTDNIHSGLAEINHKLPYFIIPLYFVACLPLGSNHAIEDKNGINNVLKAVFGFYVAAIGAGILWGFVHYIIDPYADSRMLVFRARNISFAFHICFTASMLLIYSYKTGRHKKLVALISVLFIAYMITAELISGIICMILLAFATLIFVCRRKNRLVSLIIILFAIIFAGYSSFWLAKQYDNYFIAKEEFCFNPQETTLRGHKYKDPHGNDFMENGYYVYLHSCPQEVDSAWLARAGFSMKDTSPANHPYYEVIYRYLNSKGLKKDAAGVDSLTTKDIENIKKGYSNYIYAERFSLKPRLYQTFYEFERFNKNNEAKDKSIIQRLVWSKNALKVIKDKFLIGTGTGNVKATLDKYLVKTHPELCEPINDPHNQILYTATEFGLLGLAVLCLFILYPAINLRLYRNPYYNAFIITVLCWMFAESYFERYDGMTFVITLMSYFCMNARTKIQSK